MGKLMIFNLILVALIAVGLCLIKKYVKRERTKNLILGAAAIFTILFHYSTFGFKLLTGGNADGGCSLFHCQQKSGADFARERRVGE